MSTPRPRRRRPRRGRRLAVLSGRSARSNLAAKARTVGGPTPRGFGSKIYHPARREKRQTEIGTRHKNRQPTSHTHDKANSKLDKEHTTCQQPSHSQIHPAPLARQGRQLSQRVRLTPTRPRTLVRTERMTTHTRDGLHNDKTSG